MSATNYLIIDGDGHHEETEPGAMMRVFDLIVSNPVAIFKCSQHTLGGFPVTVIEIVDPYTYEPEGG